MKWWFSKKKPEEETQEKLNPAQHLISRNEGPEIYSRENYTDYRKQYEQLEIVNRGVNMIVDDASDIPVDMSALPVRKAQRMQSKRNSMNEVFLNTFSGFVVSYCVTFLMLPYMERIGAFSVTCLFTVISLIRSYFWRRLFNRKIKIIN